MFLSVLKGIISRAIGGGGTSNIKTDLVSWWAMDDDPATTCVDSHGANDLTVNGSVVSSATAIQGKSFSTDADWLTKDPTGTDLATTGAFTIAAWVRWDSKNNGTYSSIAYRGLYNASSGSTRDFTLAYWDGASPGIRLALYTSSGTEIAISTVTSITLNQWYFVVGIFNPVTGKVKISVDNETPVETTYIGTPNNNGSYFALARGPYSGVSSNWDLDGFIDEVGFWTRELSVDEISYLYNSGAGRAYSDLPSPPISSTLLNNMVSWWDLEEASGTRSDAHGSNDLTDQNTVTSATGKVGDAASFDSANSEYLENTSVSLDISSSFSFSGWFQVTDVTGGVRMNVINVIETITDGSSPSFYLDTNGSDLRLFTYTSAGFEGGVVLTPISINTWYNWAIIFDSGAGTHGTFYVYINNSLEYTLALVNAPTSTTTMNLRLGRANNFDNRYLDGLEDSVGFWNRTLTVSEIADLWNNGSGISYSDIPLPPSNLLGNLVSWWAMDEASGDVLDSHGSNTITEGGTISSGTGIVSNCRLFSNANNSTGIRTSADFYWTGTGFSLAGWIYLETTFNAGTIVSYGSAAGGGLNSTSTQWRLYWDGTNLRFYVGNGTSWASAPIAASKGQWYFFAGIYDHDNTKISISLDAGTPAETTFTGAEEALADTLRLANEGSYECDVRLDEVAYWNRPLTSGEVVELYNSGSGLAYSGLSITDPTDISGNIIWLDAADRGTTTNQWDDKSGQGNHFTSSIAGEFPTFAAGEAVFDGIDDNLDGPNLSSLTEGEIFIVQKRYADNGDTGTNTGWWAFGTSGQRDHFTYSNLIYTDFGRGFRQAFNPTEDLSQYHIYNIRSQPNGSGEIDPWEFYIDGVYRLSTATNTVTFPTATRLGVSSAGSYFFQGSIKAVVMYNRALGQGERTKLMAYLNAL